MAGTVAVAVGLAFGAVLDGIGVSVGVDINRVGVFVADIGVRSDGREVSIGTASLGASVG